MSVTLSFLGRTPLSRQKASVKRGLLLFKIALAAQTVFFVAAKAYKYQIEKVNFCLAYNTEYFLRRHGA